MVELDAPDQPVRGPDEQVLVKSFADSGLSFSNRNVVENLLNGLQEAALTHAQCPAEGGVSQNRLSLDLNKFLKVGETLQVVYRRIH